MASSRVFVGVVFDKEFRRPAFVRELIAGMWAGQVAGLAMAVALMAIFSVFLRTSPFYPLEVIGASVLGESVVGRVDVRTLAVGMLVHQLGPAFVWGLFYGAVVWLFKPRRSMPLMLLGLLVGALSEVVDVHCMLPWLSGGPAVRLLLFEPLRSDNVWRHVPAAASWLAHLVFGFTLSFYPWKYDPIARSFD
jgi:hypothetical protein